MKSILVLVMMVVVVLGLLVCLKLDIINIMFISEMNMVVEEFDVNLFVVDGVVIDNLVEFDNGVVLNMMINVF